MRIQIPIPPRLRRARAYAALRVQATLARLRDGDPASSLARSVREQLDRARAAAVPATRERLGRAGAVLRSARQRLDRAWAAVRPAAGSVITVVVALAAMALLLTLVPTTDDTAPAAVRPAATAPLTPTVPETPQAPAVPTPPAAHPAPAPAAPVIHPVVAGDTLARIAVRYGVPIEQIAGDNRIADPNRIHVGQRLVINPATPGVEVIQPGSTPSGYAERLGLRLDELASLNPQLHGFARFPAGGAIRVWA